MVKGIQALSLVTVLRENAMFKHHKMKMDKVRNFLHAMGADNPRRFRKIKRIAVKRCSYPGRPQPQGAEIYETIYEAFSLRRYTMYGGYYWEDFRPLVFEEDPEHPWRLKKRRATQEELGSCRTWGLHGPVKKEYVMYCAWCGVTEGVTKRTQVDRKGKEFTTPYCDKCHDIKY